MGRGARRGCRHDFEPEPTASISEAAEPPASAEAAEPTRAAAGAHANARISLPEPAEVPRSTSAACAVPKCSKGCQPAQDCMWYAPRTGTGRYRNTCRPCFNEKRRQVRNKQKPKEGVRAEDGISRMYSSVEAGRDYAALSTDRQYPHRYKSGGQDGWHCAHPGCPSRRQLLRHGQQVEVRGIGDHNHDVVSVGKYSRLTLEQKSLIAKSPEYLPPKVFFDINKQTGLSAKQLRNARNRAAKDKNQKTWSE